jgi:hypothetical protein
MGKLSGFLGILIVMLAIGYFGAHTNYTVNGINPKIVEGPGADPDVRYEMIIHPGTGEPVYLKYVRKQTFELWAGGPGVGAYYWYGPVQQLSVEEFLKLSRPGIGDIVSYIWNLTTVQIDDVPAWEALILDVGIIALIAIVFLFVRGG